MRGLFFFVMTIVLMIVGADAGSSLYSKMINAEVFGLEKKKKEKIIPGIDFSTPQNLISNYEEIQSLTIETYNDDYELEKKIQYLSLSHSIHFQERHILTRIELLSFIFLTMMTLL